MKWFFGYLISLLILQYLPPIIFEIQESVVKFTALCDSIPEWQHSGLFQLNIMLLHEIFDRLVVILLLLKEIYFDFIFLFPSGYIFFKVVLDEALNISKSVVKLVRVPLYFIPQVIYGMLVDLIHFFIFVRDQHVGVKFIGFGSQRVTSYFDQGDFLALGFQYG